MDTPPTLADGGVPPRKLIMGFREFESELNQNREDSVIYLDTSIAFSAPVDWGPYTTRFDLETAASFKPLDWIWGLESNSTILIGIAAIITGAFEIVHAFRTKRWGGFLRQYFLGTLYVAFGLVPVSQPVSGAVHPTCCAHPPLSSDFRRRFAPGWRAESCEARSALPFKSRFEFGAAHDAVAIRISGSEFALPRRETLVLRQGAVVIAVRLGNDQAPTAELRTAELPCSTTIEPTE